jgi:hypothetical protein
MQGDFAPCNGYWYGPCYKPPGVQDFPIRKKLDGNGELLEEEDEDERFKIARAGNHLMVP